MGIHLSLHGGRLEDNAKVLDFTGRRKCNKCGHIKIHAHFKKDKTRPFGIQKICKDCDNVVWPKHTKRKAAQQARSTTKQQKVQAGFSDIVPVPPAQPSDFDVRPQSAMVDLGQQIGKAMAAQVQTYTKKFGVPVGLQAHPDSSRLLDEKDLPAGLQPGKPTVITATTPVDPQAVLQSNRIAQSAATDVQKVFSDRFKEALKKITEERRKNTALQNPCKEIPLEGEEQAALRRKMERDGFDQKIIDGAVKLLPMILKDLKELGF